MWFPPIRHSFPALLLWLVPGAAAAGAEEPAAAPSAELARFEACQVMTSDARGDAVSLELLTHVQGQGASPERLAAVADRAASEQALALVRESHPVGELFSRAVCRETQAPDGDVEYELSIRLEGDRTEISVVDVEARSAALPASGGGSRCQTDRVQGTYCARSPQGTAVVNPLGAIACARGECVFDDRRRRWACSRRAGGWARMGTRAAECELGCYQPTTSQCRRM